MVWENANLPFSEEHFWPTTWMCKSFCIFGNFFHLFQKKKCQTLCLWEIYNFFPFSSPRFFLDTFPQGSYNIERTCVHKCCLHPPPIRDPSVCLRSKVSPRFQVQIVIRWIALPGMLTNVLIFCHNWHTNWDSRGRVQGAVYSSFRLPLLFIVWLHPQYFFLLSQTHQNAIKRKMSTNPRYDL